MKGTHISEHQPQIYSSTLEVMLSYYGRGECSSALSSDALSFTPQHSPDISIKRKITHHRILPEFAGFDQRRGIQKLGDLAELGVTFW